MSDPGNTPSTEAVDVTSVNLFGVTVNLYNVILTMGRHRIAVLPSGVQQQLSPEWIGTIAIPIPAAAQLHKMLGTAVAAYESQFGKIPEDPKFRIDATPGGKPDPA